MRSGSASSKRTNSSFRFFTTMPFQILIFSFESSYATYSYHIYEPELPFSLAFHVVIWAKQQTPSSTG